MVGGVERNIYIHDNYNRNEIREVVLHNAVGATSSSSTDHIINPDPGESVGLLYYDTTDDRIKVWDGLNWIVVKYLSDGIGSGNISKKSHDANVGNQLVNRYEIGIDTNLVMKSQILNVTLNGVELPSISYSIGSSVLIIDTDYLGYEIDAGQNSNSYDHIIISYMY